MSKKVYTNAEIEIKLFDTVDVIVASVDVPPTLENDDTEVLPG